MGNEHSVIHRVRQLMKREYVAAEVSVAIEPKLELVEISTSVVGLKFSIEFGRKWPLALKAGHSMLPSLSAGKRLRTLAWRIQKRALIARSRWVEAIRCSRRDIDRPDLIVASAIVRNITAEVRLALVAIVLGRRRYLNR
jgi:hypothetical protein